MSLIGGINLSGDAAREAMREVARASLRAEAKRESSQYQQAVQDNHLNSFIRNLSQLRFRAKALDMQADFDAILHSNKQIPEEVIKQVQDQSESFQEGLEAGARSQAPEQDAANAARARVVAAAENTAQADQARARGDGTPPDLREQWQQLAKGDTRGQATPTRSEPAPSAAAQASAAKTPAEPTPPPSPATPPPTTPSATEIVTRMPGETQTLPTPRRSANVGPEGEPVKVAVPEQPTPIAESTRTLAEQEGPTQGGPLAEATPPPTAGETQPPGTVRIIRRGERKASEPPESAEAQLLTAGPTLRSMEAGLRLGTPTTARDAARMGAAHHHDEGETIASIRRRTPSKGEPRGGAPAASASRRGSALDPREVAVRLRSEPIRG